MELTEDVKAGVPSIVALIGSRSLFGAERANIDLLRMMQDSGARVTCVVRDEDWPENERLRRFLEDHGLEWRACPFASYPTWRYWRYWPNVASEIFRAFTEGNRTMRQICEAVEATHIHSFNPFMTLSFLPALSKLNIPLIYRCGERPIEHNLFYSLIWLWLRKRISHIGTESNYLKDILLRKGFNAKNITLTRTPPPYRNKEFELKIITKNVEKKYNKSTIKFCFVGQISESKGVKILIDAFSIIYKTHKNSYLFIAGSIQDEWARQLHFEVEGGCEKGVIQFLGHIEDVHGLLQECDVHVAPSLKPEGYGLVAVEAKQAGRPSIVFAGGGLSELVEDQIDGVVVHEKTPEALAEAMLIYCRNPEKARADGERAKASLTERIGTHRYAERWRAIYDRTMANIGGHAALSDRGCDEA